MEDVQTVTIREYRGFQAAFDWFNEHLFDGTLPDVLITLQRHPKSKGYFSPNRFSGRSDDAAKVHELALNPDVFTGRNDEAILSTLVHEMVHLWQTTYGKPQRSGYHDKQWTNKMESIGLMPSHTGEAGGKKTGQKITHFIVQDGPYQVAYTALNNSGFTLEWQSAEDVKAQKASQKKRDSKTKFTCPQCRQNVWAKPEAKVVCGICFAQDEETIRYMIPDGGWGKDNNDLAKARSGDPHSVGRSASRLSVFDCDFAAEEMDRSPCLCVELRNGSVRQC